MPTRAQTLRARQLRSAPTGVESRLWSILRRRNLAGFKFRRQVPLGPYFADFACHEAHLVVEIDGPIHDPDYDARRDAWFTRAGYTTLRLDSDIIFWEIETAIGTILTHLNPAPPPHSP